MFRKTQIRLVTLNVIVFVLLLNGLGTALYASIHYRLFSQVDQELLQIGKRVSQAPLPVPMLRFERRKGPNMDRRIVVLLWDERGQIYRKDAGEAIEQEDLLNFRPEADEERIETRTVNGQPYRVYTIPVNPAEVEDGPWRTVRYIQLICNLEPEEKMLETLLYVLGAGGIVSIIIAVVAGLFLAKRALVPIQRSWEKQQQFIADASHELRTPLSVILVNLERLFRYPDHTIEQESEHISVSIQETKRLNKLVSDLLTLARSDSNELQIMKERVRLDEIVQNSVQTFEQLAVLKNIRIQTRIEPPVELMGDKERLQQLMVILLDNALKYSHEAGRITVTCRREGNWATLAVEDTGIGIPKEDIAFIFDRFFRGDKMRSRETDGTGLGLSIAKWIVEAHGGKIRAESEVGVGSTFTVSLPCRGHR
ncbi:HAMP domain-containing histidine kinase [Brevibacillus sp. SYP-B805]|uniref:sensor histidine kinase n=1 Tax=Brevibacillus sp. SYP-B805 TaxID=1578199 RepID=UPI0013EB246E|nr:HAMP domain-containing sensor histidine kinase [Brevibacillus sp. SYP-B805]NGQ97379.1 HAMP domain-containing histidine kinase [Brevibacillus sp. SYP-B805]